MTIPMDPRPQDYPSALAAFNRWVHEHTAEILTDPLLAQLASAATTLASHATSEHARLRAELDRYHGRDVHFTTDANLETAALTLDPADTPPGTVIRATDTGRELYLTTARTWVPRAP